MAEQLYFSLMTGIGLTSKRDGLQQLWDHQEEWLDLCAATLQRFLAAKGIAAKRHGPYGTDFRDTTTRSLVKACETCETAFIAQRSSAKFCSGACRDTAKRRNPEYVESNRKAARKSMQRRRAEGETKYKVQKRQMRRISK